MTALLLVTAMAACATGRGGEICTSAQKAAGKCGYASGNKYYQPDFANCTFAQRAAGKCGITPPVPKVTAAPSGPKPIFPDFFRSEEAFYEVFKKDIPPDFSVLISDDEPLSLAIERLKEAVRKDLVRRIKARFALYDSVISNPGYFNRYIEAALYNLINRDLSYLAGLGCAYDSDATGRDNDEVIQEQFCHFEKRHGRRFLAWTLYDYNICDGIDDSDGWCQQYQRNIVRNFLGWFYGELKVLTKYRGDQSVADTSG